jgi:hypothetical protein
VTIVWLIEYQDCARPCWIAAELSHHSFGITYNAHLARRFSTAEDARNWIRKLELAKDYWKAVERILPN